MGFNATLTHLNGSTVLLQQKRISSHGTAQCVRVFRCWYELIPTLATMSGENITFPGAGLPYEEAPEVRGDWLVTLNVQFPKRVREREWGVGEEEAEDEDYLGDEEGDEDSGVMEGGPFGGGNPSSGWWRRRRRWRRSRRRRDKEQRRKKREEAAAAEV